MTFEQSTSNTILPEGLRGHWYNAPSFSDRDPWHGVDPATTAVVLVDLINWQVDPRGANLRLLREGGARQQADHLEGRCASTVLPRLARVLESARTAGALVVHARLASRTADGSDIVPALAPYVVQAEAFEGGWGAAVLPSLGPEPDDLSVVKTGSGAFSGSDLDAQLRGRGVTTLVYAGAVTNACVLLSVAAGFDLGYRQYLLTDCTAALSDADQDAAEHFIGAYLAQLTTADEACAALQRVPPGDR
jgi:nicotinamidase-related amidase